MAKFSTYKSYTAHDKLKEFQHSESYEKVVSEVVRDLDTRLNNIEHFLEYKVDDMLQLEKMYKAAKALRFELKQIEQYGVRMDSVKDAVVIIEDAFPQLRHEKE
jgi:cell shape-determining protein MreC